MHLIKLYRADFFQPSVTEFKVVTIYESFARVGLYPGLCWVHMEERKDKILLSWCYREAILLLEYAPSPLSPLLLTLLHHHHPESALHSSGKQILKS